jgi:hypothetical protein
MFYRTKILLLAIFVCFANFLFAQGELQTDREPDNYNLNSYGIKLNSNGYGLYYSYSNRINFRLRNFAEAEYNYHKDPKEIKVINPYFDAYNTRKFVFGKTHTVHNIKVGYGYNKMIYEKRDKNSISIHITGSVGAILSISKPIYYEIVDSVKISNTFLIPYTSFYKIDINFQNNPTDIIGKAPFGLGLNELKIHPGLYAKFGLQFDFSQDVMKTKVLETGAIFDSYLVPIEIMAGKENNFFLSLYLSYHFGKKYDANLNREYRKEQRKDQRRFR